jgi:hypothetical protein
MKMPPTLRQSIWPLSVALIAAAALAISACGGSPDQEVIAGNQAEDLAGANRPDPSELGARELVIAALNAESTESSRVRVSTDTDGVVQEQESEIDEHGNTRTIMHLAAGLEDPEAQASVEMLMVDDAVYGRLSIPEELRSASSIEFPDGWMTVGRETMELFGISCGPPVPGAGLAGDECVPPNDLSEMADFVLEATIAGRETVRGVETIRVQSALDLKSLMELAFGDAVDGSLMELTIAMMPNELPIELWVDDDLRTHRLSMELTLNFEALSEELGSEIDEVPTVVAVMDFYDFGADITIEAPRPAEIVGEFGEWLEDLGFTGLLQAPVSDPITTA